MICASAVIHGCSFRESKRIGNTIGNIPNPGCTIHVKDAVRLRGRITTIVTVAVESEVIGKSNGHTTYFVIRVLTRIRIGAGRAEVRGQHGPNIGEHSCIGQIHGTIGTQFIIERRLIQEGKNKRIAQPAVFIDKAGRENAVCFVVVVQCQTNLLQIVFALAAASRFACLLDGGQQECDQNGDDRNHDQQFDQGETSFADGECR